MLFVLSGGGTAGHINPAIALAEELRERGHEVRFAGTPGGIEARLIPQAGFEFMPFEASGFNRRHPLSLLKALRLLRTSLKAAKRWFAQLHPDAVVGFGGYVCVPVCRAAQELGIPMVLHEQNSVMGVANRQLAKRATKVALTYEVAGRALGDASKLVLTGNPVRSSIFVSTRAEGRAYLGFDEDDVVLLVFGGSLGARHINTAVCALKERLLAMPGLRIVQVTGPKELETVQQALQLSEEQAARWVVKGYEDQMGKVMAACDATVARAGATSLAEISARQIPALLVPFPYATADHQTMNARSYVEAGAAFMVADADVEGEEFAQKLFELLEDAELRARMRQAAAGFETADAAAKLADVVVAAATGEHCA